jgi:sugar lactone lactonase YvrE
VLRGGPDVGSVATPAASILIDATANPSARAESVGVAVGLLGGVGISLSTATVTPTVTAAVNSAGSKGLAADALTVKATLAPVESGRQTADAKAIAGGGGYYGIGGSNASAIGGGSVTSQIGDSVRLPDGDVTVVAAGTTRQKSDATAVAVGFYGVGAAVSSAVGQVTTLAQLGTGIASSALRRGDLVVTATGDNQNTAASTGGSGGAIAGNASVASTRDTSTAAAEILGTTLGGAIYAGSIRVTADQLTDYSLGAFSANVAMLGASGAFAANTSSTSATTTIGTGSQFVAVDAGEAVRLASRNRIQQSSNDYSASGGAGGGISGAAALSTSDITNSSSAVSVGVGAKVRSDNPLGSITVVASHQLQTSDKVMMESGGLLTGAGVNSKITAALTNSVTLGDNSSLQSAGDIHVGTYTTANATTNAYVSTWGLAGLGSATATIGITSEQNVTVGTGSKIMALGNVNLTAGKDMSTNNQTSLAGKSLASGFIIGLIAVPVTKGETNLTSRAALDIKSGAEVRSVGNIQIAANPGAALPTSNAFGFGNGIKSKDFGSVTPETSGVLTQSGTVEAGIWSDLRLEIAAGTSVPVIVSDPDKHYPFTVTVDPAFNPVAYVTANFDAEVAPLMRDGVSSTNVTAIRIQGLRARGGAVTVDATAFDGRGSITSRDGATISVVNKSNNYLIVGDVLIPDVPGGIFFTGLGQRATAEAKGITLTVVGENRDPSVKIENSFNGPSGTSTFGPAVFIDASIQNLGGGVTVTNVKGSVGQTATVSAASFNLFAPTGVYVVPIKAPETNYFVGADPIADWDRSVTFPGGNPATTPTPDARMAAAYAVNAWAGGGLSTGALNNKLLFEEAGRTYVVYGGSAAWSPLTQGNRPDLSPIGQATYFHTSSWLTGKHKEYTADKQYYPTVPGSEYVTLSQTRSFADNSQIESATSTIEAGKISIKALIINVNGTIKSGRKVSLDVTMNQADLDGLRSLYNTLTQNGVVLPTEIVNGSGEVTNADVRPVIAAIKTRMGDTPAAKAAIYSVLSYQYLGYFNGTQTAHIPLEAAIPALRRQEADVYAAAQAYGSGALVTNWNGVGQTAIAVRDTVVPISPELTSAQWIATYAASIRMGSSTGTAFPYSTSDNAPAFDDSIAAVTFDLKSGVITSSDVEAAPSGGFVQLIGGIINTRNGSKILAAGGGGQVRIDNQTSYPLVMNTIRTAVSGSATETSCVVNIIDTMKPAATAQTVYIYSPREGVKQATGAANVPYATLITQATQQSGSGMTKVAYVPHAGLRYQWEMQARVWRDVKLGQDSPWMWDTYYGGTESQPWLYRQLSGSYSTKPFGWVAGFDPWSAAYPYDLLAQTKGNLSLDMFAGSLFSTTDTADFVQRITGSMSFGTSQSVINNGLGISLTWPNRTREYVFATSGRVEMKMSVKADNPFDVSFDVVDGIVDVRSAGPLTLLGQVVNPQGTTTVRADGDLTTKSSFESGDLTITAPGSGIGSTAAALPISLTAGAAFNATASSAGVYATSSGVFTLGTVTAVTSATYGNVVISGASGIRARGGVTNVMGRSITLESTQGSIGDAVNAVAIQTNGADGVVNASASGDIRLTQPSGDLRVESIRSASGDVTVNVPAGKVLNFSNKTTASALSQDQIQSIWADLRLTDRLGAQSRRDDAVKTFQNQVATQYRTYWQLSGNGSVSGGTYALKPSAVQLYRSQAAVALGKASAATTDAEVQTYARGLFADVLAFFDRTFATSYWQFTVDGKPTEAAAALASASRSWLTRPEFVTYQQAFAYAATSLQQQALTMNATWTEGALSNAISLSALSAMSDRTDVGTSVAANITGGRVTINDASVTPTVASGVGRQTAPVIIGWSDLQNNLLDDTQRAALIVANAPGDIQVFGVSSASAIAKTGTASSGSATVRVNSSAFLKVGMAVTGAGSAPLTTVTRISSTWVTNPGSFVPVLRPTVILSKPTTAALSNTSLQFSNSYVPIQFDGGMPILPVGVTLSHLSLPQTAPLFTGARSTVSIRTQGDIYLQSTVSDLIAGRIESAAGDIELVAPGSILAASGTSLVSSGSDLNLLAGTGSIGSSGTPLPIKVGATLLSAAAARDVRLTAADDLIYDQIHAGDTASVVASGLIIDSGSAGAIIRATNVSLSSLTGDVGQTTSAVQVSLREKGSFTGAASGGLTVSGSADDDVFRITAATSTAGDVSLAVDGDAQLGKLAATKGTLSVTASRGIQALVDETNIRALNAALEAGNGSIGTFSEKGAATGFVRQAVTGRTNARANSGRIALKQDEGDVRVGGITASGEVFLTAAAGSILEATGSVSSVIDAKAVTLVASGSIGQPGQDLVVNTAAGSPLFATAGSGIQLTEESGDLIVGKVTSTTSGGVRLTVPAGGLSLPAAATLSATGPVLLQVRGDVTLDAASSPTAGSWFAVVGNYGKTGSGADSVIKTTRGNGSSVITAAYTSIGTWAATGQGAATAAAAGYSDAGKTTLATLGLASAASTGPVATDTSGNVYFFDPATKSLRQLDWTGSVRTLVSSGLNGASGLAVDAAGNVLIADRDTLPVVVADRSFETPSGTARTVRGPVTGSPWVFNNAGAGLASNGAILGRDGFLAPNAPNGSQVAFIEARGASISQSVQFEAGWYTLSVAATQKTYDGLVSNQQLGIYVDDVSVGTLIPVGTTYTTLTTPAFQVAAGARTIEIRGMLNQQYGWSSGSGALIDSVQIASAQAPAIKVWNAATGVLSTLVTTTNAPSGVAVDAAGNVFYSDGTAVKQWAAATAAVSTILTGSAPRGLATDAAGNVYAADATANVVKKWTASTGGVSTLSAFTGLNGPQAVAVDAAGDVYVADTGNNLVRKLSTGAGSASTLIATGLNRPTGVAIDTIGNVFTLNNGTNSSTLDAFQPGASVPTATVTQLDAAGSDVLPVVMPATQSLYGSFLPTSDSSWLKVTGAQDGVVRYSFDAAPDGLARTGRITVLGRQVTVVQAAGRSATAIVTAAPVAYGSNGTVSLRVSSTLSTPTGNVMLSVNGGTPLSGTLAPAGSSVVNGVTTYAATATITVTGLLAGDHALVASYESQSKLSGSTTAGSIRVNQAATVAAISVTASAVTYGDAITLTGSVPRVGSGVIPTGWMRIMDGSVQVGRAQLTSGSFAVTTRSLPGGSRSFTAVYEGDANYVGSTSGSASKTIAKKSAVPTLTGSATSSTYGGTVTYTASVPTAVAGTVPTGTIQFFDGSVAIGSPVVLTNGQAALATATLAGGSHPSIKAV